MRLSHFLIWWLLVSAGCFRHGAIALDHGEAARALVLHGLCAIATTKRNETDLDVARDVGQRCRYQLRYLYLVEGPILGLRMHLVLFAAFRMRSPGLLSCQSGMETFGKTLHA